MLSFAVRGSHFSGHVHIAQCCLCWRTTHKHTQDRSYSREINSNAAIKRFDNTSNKSPTHLPCLRCRTVIESSTVSLTLAHAETNTDREHYYMMCVLCASKSTNSAHRISKSWRPLLRRRTTSERTAGSRNRLAGIGNKSYFDKRTAGAYSVRIVRPLIRFGTDVGGQN